MKWSIVITREAEEDLEKLDSSIRRKILLKMKWLRDNFDNITPLPLSSKWKGFFKFRVGDWRIIYEIENKKSTVTIHFINKRDKIYKK